MPRYKVIVECSGPHGNAALTYRINAASQFAAEFRACQLAGDHYPEYRGVHLALTLASMKSSTKGCLPLTGQKTEQKLFQALQKRWLNNGGE